MSNENNNEIAIKQGDECVVVAQSYRGWASRKTLGEAIKAIKKHGRYTDKELLEALMDGEIGIYVTNADKFCVTQYSVNALTDGAVMFLGNECNNVLVYGKQ